MWYILLKENPTNNAPQISDLKLYILIIYEKGGHSEFLKTNESSNELH